MLQKVRENDNYMKLSRMGSRYPSRLSFSRSMLRRLINDNWEIHKSKFDLDKYGFGTVVYEIIINKQTYSLVCFSAFLDDKDRSCLLYTSPSPRDIGPSRMPSSA